MIGASITHRDWSTPTELLSSARRVTIYARYSERLFRNMFLTIKTTLKEDGNLPSKSINYSNTRKHVIDLKTKSEREFDPDNVIHSTEVLAVHGQLSKAEKHHYTQIFLNLSHPDDGNICVLVATRDVGNVGIDSPDIRNFFECNSYLRHWIFYRRLVESAVSTHRIQKHIHTFYTTASKTSPTSLSVLLIYKNKYR